MSSKQSCPHCNKSFVNLALHVTKVHDAWMLEAVREKQLCYDFNTKTRVMKDVITSWTLSKNNKPVCIFTSAWGDMSFQNKRYIDWHGDDSCPYVMLEDCDGDDCKIVYAHYKSNSTGISSSSSIVCDNLTVIF